MAKEELRLVTDFGELRAGDAVLTIPCKCGKTHGRVILLSKGPGRVDGVEDVERWTFAPQAGCQEAGSKGRVLTRITVAERRVHLVDTGLESSTHETTHRTKEAAR